MLDEHQQIAVARGLRDGSRDAWAMLYDGYSLDVWRYVARLVSHHDVADVVQETMLAAARSARQFDSRRGSLWSWLTGIAHHHAVRCWRRSDRAARLRQMAADGKLQRGVEDGQTLDALLQQRELCDLVRCALAEISADYATLLTAKYLDECSLEEMAASLGSSLEAIKSKLARARKEFRARFEALMREPTPTLRE